MVSTKRFAIGLLCFSGFAVFTARADSNLNRTLSCTFTEPFYDIDLDLDSGRLTRTEYDWAEEEPNSDFITKVLDEHATVKLSSTGSGVRIVAQNAKTAKIYLDGTYDFKGSNGMSDHDYPVSVVHHWDSGRREYGGCHLGTIRSFERHAVDEDVRAFAEYATQAMGLCLARAVSDWTAVKSDYEADNTKFYVLYRSDFVPGEPGQVSSTFSSSENEELASVLAAAQHPASDAVTMTSLRQGMWNYCMRYSQFLQTRYTPLEVNHAEEEN